jgi:6-phosphogluconolactonase
MGDDGHTASIFPDQMHLLESDQICKVAIHPQSRQKRVTLTGQPLNNASKVWFVITGASKAEKLKTILLNDNSAQFLPAAHIKLLNGELVWYADKEAAGKVGSNQ